MTGKGALDTDFVRRQFPGIDDWAVFGNAGDFYAARLIDAIGAGARNGVVRASMVHCNTPAEVDRLTRGLDEVI